MKQALTCLLFLISLTACEKLLISKDPANTPTENARFLWQTINEKYTFLDFKRVNWDSVGRVWLPRVSDTMNDVLLFRICDSMLYTLRDGHVNLFASFNFSRNWQSYLNHPDNFDEYLLERNYLRGNQRITGGLVNTFMDSNRVGYIRYSSFSRTVSDFDIDVVLARFRDTKGIIFDVRSNGGGSSANVEKLLSRFTNKKVLIWRTAEKVGTGKNELGNFKDQYAEPAGSFQYTKPVMLLTNRRSYSATSFFTAAMLAFPNVKVIGDWTGGGGGTPSSTQLPNGWTLRYSATATLMPTGFNIEDGTPPTIRQNMLKSDSDRGFDSIIEKALQELK
jgi:hypothetical protein